MIEFILNNKRVSEEKPPKMTALEFLRDNLRLTGTRQGCREGECGSCMVLLGKREENTVNYGLVNSCLLPLGDLSGMHLVTIEGLNDKSGTGKLSPIQQAVVDEGAVQCGYCTPGIVVALTGFFLNGAALDGKRAIAQLSGNLCRCTGYAGLKRAARLLCRRFTLPEGGASRIRLLIEWGILPAYFSHIPVWLKELDGSDAENLKAAEEIFTGESVVPERLSEESMNDAGGSCSEERKIKAPVYAETPIGVRKGKTKEKAEKDAGKEGITGGKKRCRCREAKEAAREIPGGNASPSTVVAGGTDLFVQKPEALYEGRLEFLSRRKELKGIKIEDDHCRLGAATTFEEMKNSTSLGVFFPEICGSFKSIASSAIRNRATLGGNIVNASPVGDPTIILLALDGLLTLTDGEKRRNLPLRKFYKGYRKTDLGRGEILERVSFAHDRKKDLFNFEKVSKRPDVDIATVNTAIRLRMEGETIVKADISAGGVGPVPLFLSRTSSFLSGKRVTMDHVGRAAALADTEIAPIDDLRGKADYRRLLLRQLLFAHFITLFPKKIDGKIPWRGLP